MAVGKSEAKVSGLKSDNSKAREFYQQGLYHWHRYTHTEINLAISFFKKSIKENPEYALPYAGLADSYSVIGVMGFDAPKTVFALAKEALKKALQLNDKRSESYVSAAFINLFFDWDFDKAKTNLEQALKLNKDNVNAHHVLSMYYTHTGNLPLVEKHALLTIKKDPLAVPYYAMVCRTYIFQKKFELAMDYANAAINIDGETPPLLELRG